MKITDELIEFIKQRSESVRGVDHVSCVKFTQLNEEYVMELDRATAGEAISILTTIEKNGEVYSFAFQIENELIQDSKDGCLMRFDAYMHKLRNHMIYLLGFAEEQLRKEMQEEEE